MYDKRVVRGNTWALRKMAEVIKCTVYLLRNIIEKLNS